MGEKEEEEGHEEDGLKALSQTKDEKVEKPRWAERVKERKTGLMKTDEGKREFSVCVVQSRLNLAFSPKTAVCLKARVNVQLEQWMKINS